MDNPSYILDFAGDLKKSHKLCTTATSHTYEDAVSLAEVGKFHYILLLVCGMAFMSVMVEIMCVSIILPTMKCDLVSTLTEQGILVSSGFLGVVLSSHAMGFLADTWGRIRTLRLTLILAVTSTITSAFSVNIWMLIVFRFFTGFFLSGGQACVFSLCGEFHSDKSRVKFVTLLSGFLPLALIYLPAIATLILPLRIEAMLWGIKLSSWRILLLTNSVLSLLAIFGFFILPESPKFVLGQGDGEGALEILRWVFVKNTGRPSSDYAVNHILIEANSTSLTNISGIKDGIKLMWNQTLALFHRERCLHTLNICGMMFLVIGISQGFFMWLPTMINEMASKHDSGHGVCHIITNMESRSDLNSDVCNGIIDIFSLMNMLMVGVASLVFFVMITFAINIISKKDLIFAFLVIGGVSLILLHWSTNFYVNVILVTLAMSIGNCTGLICTISIEFFPTNINAMGMCFILMIGRLGAFFGSNFFGHLLFNYCSVALWALLGFFNLLCFMNLCLPERKPSNI